MRYLSTERIQQKRRLKAKQKRLKAGHTPVVNYFHQVEDPYSHLAVQKLDALKAHYDIEIKFHLTSKADAAYNGSDRHFDLWAWQDVVDVAEDYNCAFSATTTKPSNQAIEAANCALANKLQAENIADIAFEIGCALWSQQHIQTDPGSDIHKETVAAGNQLRRTLGHYQGAMFQFDDEWYWGIDRIRLLEEHLVEAGLSHDESLRCVPEPTPIDTTNLNTQHITLNYFPSLRSPYTAIGHQRVLDLITRSGVQVNVKPVMPMLMRGIPAPRAKQRYIIADAAREGRAHGAALGAIVDPFGEPVKRAFALFPGAQKLNKEMEFVTAYLKASWFDGIDITKESGLREVAKSAGLDWQALADAGRGSDWQTQMERNLQTMLSANLWGVPSFQVLGGNKDSVYSCWGQDRIWRVENEIARRV